MLEDGTNEEGEDLAEPLDFSREEIEYVLLYQQELSPPCSKIRAFLNYYGVEYKVENGKHPTSNYKQIPVLEINGRQINDSHVIMQNLAPLLSGMPLTPEEVRWEKQITFGFQPALEVEFCRDGNDIFKFSGILGKRFSAGQLRFLIDLVVGPLSFIVYWVFKLRYPDYDVVPTSTYGVKFRRALGSKPFFHGEKPGFVDLSLYGTYAAWNEKGCRTVQKFLIASDLEDWHARMVEAVPSALLQKDEDILLPYWRR